MCRICGNEKNNSEFVVLEMMYGLDKKFTYFECSCCGCLQIKDIPLDMAKYYPSNYYSLNTSAVPKSFATKLLRGIRDDFAVFDKGIVGRILHRYKPDCMGLKSLSNLPLKKEYKIIDIGCGDGKLLCSLQKLGFNNLLGIDPFIAHDIDYQNGVKILKTDIRNINGIWDVVMFHHSFEHIIDQLDTLRSVNRLLDDLGTCLIRVPITSSFAWRHYGVNWVQIDAPRHFFLHSIKSMSVLAERAGFHIDKIEYDSTSFQFIGSELYLKGICLIDPISSEQKALNSFFSAATLRKFSAEARRLNARSDGDQAVFYLKKIRETNAICR